MEAGIVRHPCFDAEVNNSVSVEKLTSEQQSLEHALWNLLFVSITHASYFCFPKDKFKLYPVMAMDPLDRNMYSPAISN